MAYEPKHLELWARPDCYFGVEWYGHYVALFQTRDSEVLDRCNFQCLEMALAKVGGWRVVRDNHFLCGWIEWIAIEQSADSALEIADRIVGALEDYPIADETLLSEMESESGW